MLRWAPVTPSSVAALLGDQEAYLAFREVVRAVFPDAATEVLAARRPGVSREDARVWAFLERAEDQLFPVYEVDEYAQVAFCIPFVRNGWTYDRFHEPDLRTGELLIFVLCAQPFAPGDRGCLAALDAAESHVPRTVLEEIPAGGLTPAELHERLEGTPYVAAAEFADWMWGETETAFLDLGDDAEVCEVEWTADNVAELSDQWRRARAILGRIAALAFWLEADPAEHFARLLDAALGREIDVDYQRLRRFYACEITEAGLVPIAREEPEPIPVPGCVAA
jgi:hypothetical protein